MIIVNLKRLAIMNYWNLHSVFGEEIRFHQDIYTEALKSEVKNADHWLDLGCGHKILPEWFTNQENELTKRASSITGIDYDIYSLQHHKSIKRLVRGDLAMLPFADNSFSLVTANMVLEHLAEPEKLFHEVSRVLLPKGRFLILTPNRQAYLILLARLIPQKLRTKLTHLLENRADEDIFPTLYRANSVKALCKLGRETGFSIKSFNMITSTGMPQLAVFPPLSILELLFINLLNTRILRRFRHDILAVFSKS